jgi:hypothetical protein
MLLSPSGLIVAKCPINVKNFLWYSYRNYHGRTLIRHPDKARQGDIKPEYIPPAARAQKGNWVPPVHGLTPRGYNITASARPLLGTRASPPRMFRFDTDHFRQHRRTKKKPKARHRGCPENRFF